MGKALNVLLVEDSEDDAALVVRELRRGGYDVIFRRAQSAEEMIEALGAQGWDVVLSDHSMPRFSAAQALSILKETRLDLPFIVVSGAIGEETAVALMKAGAHDYVMKGNLARLVPAVERELRDAEVRRERRRAEAEIKQLNEDLERRVFERTAQLAAANKELESEIAERRRAEAERERVLEQLRDVNQQLAVASVLAHEQAEVAQLRAAELDATIASIPDGVVIYLPGAEIARMNPAAERLLAYSPEEARLPLEGRMALLRVESAAGKPLAPEEMPVPQALRGETTLGATVILHHAKGEIWVSVSAAPIRGTDGALLGAVAIFTDITALHEMEQQREDFISLISHDLRNPLTGIMATAEWMKWKLEKQGRTQEAHRLDPVVKNAKRMNTMIQDLVESVHLESGRMEMRRELTDLRGLIHDIAERVGTAQDRARIQVEAPEWVPPVSVDVDRMERAIVNLITNALKYSPPEAPVIVRVGGQGDEAVVSVSDQGVGIPPEDIPYLFGRFYRAKTGKKTEGFGLGLYITRLILEAHGGRVSVQSEVDKGSTFSLRLPLDNHPER